MTNPNKVGLVIAALIAGWHVVWSVLFLRLGAHDQAGVLRQTIRSDGGGVLIVIGYIFGFVGAFI